MPGAAYWLRRVFGFDFGAEGTVLTAHGPGTLPSWEAAGGIGSTDPEIVRDTIAAALVAGTATDVAINDPGNTITLNVVMGTASGTACAGNDVRLSDARTPTGHAASHEIGGGDEISVAGLSGLLADAQAPLAHAHAAEDLTSGTVGVARLPVMTSTVAGIVPTPPNNTTTFLRGDGTFAAPAGGGLTHPQILARSLGA